MTIFHKCDSIENDIFCWAPFRAIAICLVSSFQTYIVSNCLLSVMLLTQAHPACGIRYSCNQVTRTAFILIDLCHSSNHLDSIFCEQWALNPIKREIKTNQNDRQRRRRYVVDVVSGPMTNIQHTPRKQMCRLSFMMKRKRWQNM